VKRLAALIRCEGVKAGERRGGNFLKETAPPGSTTHAKCREPAKYGREMCRYNFTFNRSWQGKHYPIKQVAPVIKDEANEIGWSPPPPRSRSVRILRKITAPDQKLPRAPSERDDQAFRLPPRHLHRPSPRTLRSSAGFRTAVAGGERG
jgi:hypothetical protein